MRTYLRKDSVPIAFIAACASHHIPFGYSSTLIDLGAKLKWLVAKKASFNVLALPSRTAVLPASDFRRSRCVPTQYGNCEAALKEKAPAGETGA